MTTLSQLANEAKETDIDRTGGELFINITGKNAVTIKELKGLVGLEFPATYETAVLAKVNGVTTGIYENIDGRFLSLCISATFKLPDHEPSAEMDDEFTIWVEEEDGGEITAGDFEHLKMTEDFSIDADRIEPVIDRFGL